MLCDQSQGSPQPGNVRDMFVGLRPSLRFLKNLWECKDMITKPTNARQNLKIQRDTPTNILEKKPTYS